jgi:transcriptional regulator with XRE-family HTH domain
LTVWVVGKEITAEMAETSLRRLFRAHLRRAGYTAEELSRFLNVTPSTLSKWVNGYNPWPDDALPIIFEILGLDQAQQDEFYALVVASRSGSDAVTVNPIAARENPYRGLFSFREEDAADFFGREAFIQRLVKTVQDRPLVAVIGSSGSGKSSVIFAGLVPRLRQTNDWVIIDFRPGSDPFQALAAVLLPQYESYQTETEKLIESRRLAESLRHRELPLSDVINLIQHNESPNTRLLLVADQFEELYTLCPEPETQRRFLDILIDTFLPDPRSPIASPRHHLILSLRADFLGQALAYRPFADALQDTDLKLGPMNQTELRQSIEEPALKHRVTFEAGLVERIINDVGHPVGNLPLLEFALAELWVRQAKGRLTHAAYEAIGQAH